MAIGIPDTQVRGRRKENTYDGTNIQFTTESDHWLNFDEVYIVEWVLRAVLERRST